MRINGYRCDGCKKDEACQVSQDDIANLLAVWPVEKHLSREPWVFCSRSCLREHPLIIEETQAGGEQ